MQSHNIGQCTTKSLIVLAIWTASLLILAAGCGGPTPTPTPTPAPEVVGEPPSITLAPPGPTPIQVQPGEPLAITAKVEGGIEPQVTWTVTCLQDPKCQVLQILQKTTGTDNFFTAPKTLDEQVNVTATVKDKYGREDSATLTFKVVQEPTPTATPVPPTEILTPGPTSTATPVPPAEIPIPSEAAPIIESPAHGDEVPMLISVSGSSGEAALEPGTNLYIIVQPHGYNYHVQALPEIESDGTWTSQPVYVGQPGDEGLSFDICAVLTSQQLSRGQGLAALPQGPYSCVTVERGLAQPPSAVPEVPSPGAPVIEVPTEGDAVIRIITVSGSSAEAALEAGTNLYIIVQPHGYTYWVQALPEIESDGTWTSQPVYVGQPGDEGLSFDICAVLTSQQLRRGQELMALPPGPTSCVTVTRR